MKRERSVLIVSPYFPPANGADMHRVRVSLPYFSEFGWQPRVLAVQPDYIEGAVEDPLLLQTVPPGVPVRRVKALPLALTRRFGLGAIGIRAFMHLYRAGCSWIREARPDLVFFSSTQFPVYMLGRLWKRRFGLPFALDFQDPWVQGISPAAHEQVRPFKHRLMWRIHRFLEPRAVSDADGLVAVSEQFNRNLQLHYPRLRGKPAVTLRFAASPLDLEVAKRNGEPHGLFKRGDGLWHGVYVGRGGYNMKPALRIIMLAFAKGLKEQPKLFQRVRLHFVGTDYAPVGRGRKTVEPLAREFGLGGLVFETTSRVPFHTAVRLNTDADFLLLPGSQEPEYAASKLCSCVLARKPLLAVFHQQSNAIALLRETNAGEVVTFSEKTDENVAADELFHRWKRLIGQLPFQPDVNWDAFEPYTARDVTRRLCSFFDDVVSVARPGAT